MFRIKRAYETAAGDDGYRVLIDRLWPRGLRKEELRLDAWDKELAPSDALRRWFGHEPSRWEEFARRYRAELDAERERLRELAERGRHGTVTLVYGARDVEHNNAVVMRELLASLLER